MTDTAVLDRQGHTSIEATPQGYAETTTAVSWLVSAVAVTACTTILSILVPGLWHWMTLPTTAAGILLAVDVVEWMRGRLGVFQPRAVVALFGFHLCYLGPLLHVVWDHWPTYIKPAQDWRASLGVLALVNVAGIVLYRIVLSLKSLKTDNKVSSTHHFDRRRFGAAAAAVISIGGVALVAVMIKFGGPFGYLRVISESREVLAGNGWLLILAESWPLVLFATILVYRRRWFRTHLLPLLLLLAAFVLIQFVTGGLRGSRSNTVWPTIMAVGLIHLIVRPIRRVAVVAGVVVLAAFMYLYGFYKSIGMDVLHLATQQTTTSVLAKETGRTLPLLLLEDFGRAGTQSIVIDRLSTGGEISWGMTYVGDVVKLLPDSIVPAQPIDKSAAGTDLLYSPGAYEAGTRSSRIFGLAGEGMLNFGLIGGALAFLPFAMFVRYTERIWRTAVTSGSTLHSLICPGLTAMSVLALGSDLDNVLWLFASQVVPLAIVVLISRSTDPRLPGTRRWQTQRL